MKFKSIYNNILEDMLCYSRFSLLYMPVVPQNPVPHQARDFGSIIFVVGNPPMDIMEPILCRKKV
ncbi:TPA: hypothetical protein ACL4OQ_002018, partial [Streptococcus pneumoniae]